MKTIRMWGVRQNNLKGVEVEIPIGSFTVVCGPSGSGKSSLAFETLYAEGQRRYIESLSNYSKQFLNKAPKPDLEGIENIPPAISIEQKNGVKSSRSTVGTTTEVVDHLRLIFEKIGQAYCPDHHISLEKDSPSSGADKVLANFDGKRGYVLALIGQKGRSLSDKELLAQFLKEGYSRIYVPKKASNRSTKTAAAKGKKRTTKKILQEAQTNQDLKQSLLAYSVVPMGKVVDLKELADAKKALPKSDFYLVIDRLAFKSDDKGRLIDSLAQAFNAGFKYNLNAEMGSAEVLTTEGERILLSEDHSCSVCGFSFPSITSSLFSFNSPVGACPDCKGFGNILMIDESKVIPNPKLSLAQGAIAPFAMPSAGTDRRELRAYCKKAKIDLHTAWEDLPVKQRKALWDGNKDFYGVVGLFDFLETKKYKMHVRVFISRYKSPFTCPACKGTRLKPEAQQVLVQGKSISDLCGMTLEALSQFMQKIELLPHQVEICAEPLRQVRERLRFLNDVGVGYLTVDRPTKTLSGGEFQRLNLANQLGMGLSQTLYVLDEPTIGLHPRDNDRLIGILNQLKDLGNTLVIVEHDEDVIRSASHLIEMGPGSGHLGGEVIFAGEKEDFYKSGKSNTVPFLPGGSAWTPPRTPRPVDIEKYRYFLDMIDCRANNLKGIDLKIPLNRLVTVTGVSGSGKSTLIGHTLYPAIARQLGVEFIKGGECKSIKGIDQVKNVVFIDQSSIGKTARSNPVTYLKVYDAIRTVMASTKMAKERGYTPGTFSLNVDGGRCPVCKGLGFEVIDMMFMDDIEIRCEACDGKRFRSEILEITFNKKNIAEILQLTVAEAMDFFVAYPNIRRPLSILKEVGLDYIQLGQSANSLSGGESQRLKLARELSNTQQKATLYIMDEPTTGLHFKEVQLLLRVLNKLIDTGASVILIEHNLEVIRNSDYVIDLGPEAGEKGGKVVAYGTPEDVMKSGKGYTGKYLRRYYEEHAEKTGSIKASASRRPSSSKPAKEV